MQPSRFNVQVPLADRNEVFLMNTFSDAQLLVTPDVASLLDRVALPHQTFSAGERDTIESLVENGFDGPGRSRQGQGLETGRHAPNAVGGPRIGCGGAPPARSRVRRS